jgi:hypothetical protein
LAPRGKLCLLGVKLSPRGEDPLFAPPESGHPWGVNKGVNIQAREQSSLLGTKSAPKRKLHRWGQTHFVKTWPPTLPFHMLTNLLMYCPVRKRRHSAACLFDSVARLNISKKIQIWVNFGRSCDGRCLVFLGHSCLFYSQIVYLMAICYILWSFGIFFPRFGMFSREKSGNPALRAE